MQAQQAEQASCGAEVHAGGRVAVLVLTLTLGLLAEDPLKARGAEAALVVVAGAPVLAQQELVIADIWKTTLAPVVVGQAIVALGSGAALSALTVAGLVAAVGHRTHSIAVAVYTYILIVQLGGAIPVVTQTAVLAVLPPGVVFATDAVHHIQEVYETAAVGVTVTLAVCGVGRGKKSIRKDYLGSSFCCLHSSQSINCQNSQKNPTCTQQWNMQAWTGLGTWHATNGMKGADSGCQADTARE